MIAEAPCKDFVLRLPLRDAIRRDGRVVDYSSLENCRTERYRGFESLSLRKKGVNQQLMRFAPFITPKFSIPRNFRFSIRSFNLLLSGKSFTRRKIRLKPSCGISASFVDTVPKTCVSSKVLIFVVQLLLSGKSLDAANLSF